MANLNKSMFPYYRKLNGKAIWYKIVSEKEFHEIYRVGGRIQIDLIEAIKYPEMLRIQDMINCHEDYWTKETEDSFLESLA